LNDISQETTNLFCSLIESSVEKDASSIVPSQLISRNQSGSFQIVSQSLASIQQTKENTPASFLYLFQFAPLVIGQTKTSSNGVVVLSEKKINKTEQDSF
jgi:hypothetical protein